MAMDLTDAVWTLAGAVLLLSVVVHRAIKRRRRDRGGE